MYRRHAGSESCVVVERSILQRVDSERTGRGGNALDYLTTPSGAIALINHRPYNISNIKNYH
ncbi:MAG: hypothetical protein WC975_05195 [Phycisphaerae bacterium]